MFKNISFVGMAGCGKSTIGKALSIELSISYADTDLLIESKYNESLENIKRSKGYKFIRMEEERTILNLNKDFRIVSTGGSAIYSNAAMSHLKSFTKVIYILTPLNIIKKRIGDGQERGFAVPDGMSIEDVFYEREPLYNKWADKTVDGSLSIDQLIKIISKF
jgi:shikimate kinase